MTTVFINNLCRLNHTISKLTIKICLHSLIIVVRQSLAAFCSNSSLSSGTPIFFRLRRGLAVGLFFGPHIWKSDGAKQTARLLDVICKEKKLCVEMDIFWNVMTAWYWYSSWKFHLISLYKLCTNLIFSGMLSHIVEE